MRDGVKVPLLLTIATAKICFRLYVRMAYCKVALVNSRVHWK